MVKINNFSPISIVTNQPYAFDESQKRLARQLPSNLMVIKEKEMHGVPVLVLSGKLDLFARNSFRDVIQKQKEKKAKRVVIDMKSVSFIDSAGLGVLAIAVKTFKEIQGNLILVNPQDMVKGILNNSNFSALLPMFNSNEDYSEFSALS